MARSFPKNKRLTWIGLIWMLGCSACGQAPYPFHSLLEQQPTIAATEPAAGTELGSNAEIQLQFSERIDLGKIGPETVALLASVKDEKLLLDSDELMDGLRESNFQTVPLQYFLDEAETGLTVSSDTPLSPGNYYLVVTPGVVSTGGVPFNQKPGEAPTPFVAVYHYGTSNSQVSSSNSPAEAAPSAPTFGPAPDKLVINEFLYDGTASETDGECFVELDGTPHADISLYQVQFINGADGTILDRVTLPPGSTLHEDGLFLIADLRTGSSTESQIEGTDLLDHFDPQNGPDGIVLIDRDGAPVDSVAYGTGGVSKTKDGLPLGEGAPANDVTAGHSLSRHSGADTDDNAADFTDQIKPSPGKL